MSFNVQGAPAAELAGRLVGMVPEALKPSFLLEAWSGSFGRDGLRAVVDETQGISSHLQLHADRMFAKAEGFGTIRPSFGGKAGDFRLETHLSPNGHMMAYAENLTLLPAAQHTGFGTEFALHQATKYAAAGIDDVETFASKQRGSLVWADMGFKVRSTKPTEAERVVESAQVVRKQVDRAFEDGRLTPAEHAELAPRLIADDGTLPPDALVSMQELAHTPDLGPKALNNPVWDPDVTRQTGWSAIYELHPERSWFDGLGLVGARDASVAPYLIPSDSIAPVTAELSRKLMGTLPEAFDVGTSLGRIEASAANEGVHLVGDRVDSATHVFLPAEGGSAGAINQRLIFDVRNEAGQSQGKLVATVSVDKDGIVSRKYKHTAAEDGAKLGMFAKRKPEAAIDQALAALDWGTPHAAA